MKSKYNSFKVLLVGDGGVGKTSFVRRLGTGTYSSQYNSTIGVEIHPLEIPTPEEDIVLDVWDTAGQEKLGPLRDKYYYNGEFAIIMFDLCSRISYKNVARWHNDITRVCNGGIPTVIIGNKVDCVDRKVHERNIVYHKGREDFMAYFETSVKHNININEPIKWILEKLKQHREGVN